MKIWELRKLRRDSEEFYAKVFSLWEKEIIQEEKDVLQDLKGELEIYIKEIQALEFEKLTGGYQANGYRDKIALEYIKKMKWERDNE